MLNKTAATNFGQSYVGKNEMTRSPLDSQQDSSITLSYQINLRGISDSMKLSSLENEMQLSTAETALAKTSPLYPRNELSLRGLLDM